MEAQFIARLAGVNGGMASDLVYIYWALKITMIRRLADKLDLESDI
jgi:predicted GNAT superfamily acetyltransferase